LNQTTTREYPLADSRPKHPVDRILAVVVTFNSARVLPGLLETLADGFGNMSWQLVVGDNDSADNSVDLVLERVPSAKIVRLGRNAGYAAAINAAVAAGGPHTAVLILNPDVRLDAGCVPELLRAVRKPGTGIAVPRLVDARGQLIESMRREPTLIRAWADAMIGASIAGRFPLLGEMVTARGTYDGERLTDWAEGSVQLVSAECWSRCGPWDESFFLYSEETEFDLRARDAGYATRFVPSATAVHLEGGSAQTPGLWRLLVLNRVRLYHRRNGPVKGAFFWMAILFREASRALLGRATARAATQALLSPKRWRELPGPEAIRMK
jgi:N-acetylglucosaminyl-diphospho-decaprenol L-rhamnosyltransferase